MIRITQLKLELNEKEENLKNKAAKLLRLKETDIKAIHIVKKSIDARKKPQVFYSYCVDVETDFEEKILNGRHDDKIIRAKIENYQFPVSDCSKNRLHPVIVGMGPAGLFCGYLLAKHGFCPVIYERGKKVEERSADVAAFWETGKLLQDSNVLFGEGGAGTFSDGKLNTLNKDKYGRNKEVLKIFVENGAPKQILYDSKPHIGTDILVNTVRNMREKMIAWGASIHYESKVSDFITEQNRVKAIVVNGKETVPVETLVLAIGHSARDTFAQLYANKLNMEAKAFAVGFRVQHPQQFIDNSQYGMRNTEHKLPPAVYKLTAATKCKRGVYSFCMCPGGYVVNASSEPGRMTVNGMSYSRRDSGVANSAIIVSVTPEDYPDSSPLSGIAFQRELEERAYHAGDGKIPVEYFDTFCGKKHQTDSNTGDFEPAIKGEYQFSNLRPIMTEEMNQAFIEGMEHFNKMIPGFAENSCLLAGIESRTSSPVRIVRDREYESNIKGIYPCGEGAGYAGGITSAAMDGMCIAERIAMSTMETSYEKSTIN